MVSRNNRSAHQPAPPNYRLAPTGVFANVGRYGVASGGKGSNMCTAPLGGTGLRFSMGGSGIEVSQLPDPPAEALAELIATLSNMALSSTAEVQPIAFLRVNPAGWVAGPGAIEQGLGESTVRSQYYYAAGANEHFWSTHNDGSTGGGIDTGYNPSVFAAELATSTGFQISLPAGFITAAARATLIAAAIAARPWCASATVAGADNANGSRTITVIGNVGGFTEIRTGARTWAQRGAAGPFGSHQFRRVLAGEIAGSLDIAITRNIAQAINTPPATARIHSVSILLGNVVSTVAANIPRLYLRSGSASTTIPGATMLFDFGQLPVSEVLVGRRARITLTPTQVEGLRTALTGATGQLWLCLKASATTTYNALPVGGGLWNGDFLDSNIRVDTVTSGAGNTAAPGAWNNAGAANAAVILSAALHYEVDPAGNGESYPIVGSNRVLATAPNEVTLPNTVTRQVTSTITGHQGAQLHTLEAQLTDAGVRYAMYGGGDITTDLDDPNLTGATTILDFGQTVATGTVTMTAPTGDASIPVPAVFTIAFKGTGLRGFGWTTLPSGNTPIQANDFILAIGGVGSVDGTNQHELDYAAESGDPTTAFTSPIAGVATQPDNLPAMRLTLRRPADSAATV